MIDVNNYVHNLVATAPTLTNEQRVLLAGLHNQTIAAIAA